MTDTPSTAPPLTHEELETMVKRSGAANYSEFAGQIQMTPESFRRIRARLRDHGEQPTPRLITALRTRYGNQETIKLSLANEMLASLIELEASYGRDAQPPHAPDPRAAWERARRLIRRAGGHQ